MSPLILKKIFKFHQYIFAISKLSSLGKGRGPSFEKKKQSKKKQKNLEPPLAKAALCQISLKSAQGSGDKA